MITQEQIQSIVDGECSHEVRAVLLRQMESEPSTWRILALSLLEEQEWSRQFSAMANCNANSKTESIQSEERPDAHALTQSQLPHASTSVQPLVALAEHADGNWTSNIGPWVSVLAASLLLSIGIYGGSYLPHFSSLDSNAANEESVAVSRNPVRYVGADESVGDKSNTNMSMLVSGPNRETAEIPIYDLKEIDHEVFAAKQAYEVARLNQKLRKEGFELDVRPEYYTGKLHDGRKLIVPVKQVALKPYGL